MLVAIIPARSGSKGIPNKNIKSFCGKPLIYWSITAAKQCHFVDEVIVSTNSDSIAAIASSYGASVPFLRSESLSNDKAQTIDVVLDLLERMPLVHDVLLLQPTSPLRSVDDIYQAYNARQIANAQSAVSVALSQKAPEWMYRLGSSNHLTPIIPSTPNVPRQVLSPAYFLNGAIYLATRQFLLKERRFVSNSSVAHVMPLERSIDIDVPLDWDIASFLKQRTEA